MPFAVVLALLNIGLIVHAAKTGRFWPWGYIILFIPGLGGLAYVLVEVLPAWFGTYQGQQTTRRVGRALNPEKRYRALKDQVDISDTIANRAALAEECLALLRFDEALLQFETILERPLGDDPVFALGAARALFGLGRFVDTVTALDDLRRRWPDFQSAEGHLLYARALEGAGRSAEAVEEYQAVSHYYPGAEPRVRLGLLLRRLGRDDEGRAIFADVIKQMRRTPRFAQKAQREWITMAEKGLQG